jgi:hypothetical protein
MIIILLCLATKSNFYKSHTRFNDNKREIGGEIIIKTRHIKSSHVCMIVCGVHKLLIDDDGDRTHKS